MAQNELSIDLVGRLVAVAERRLSDRGRRKVAVFTIDQLAGEPAGFDVAPATAVCDFTVIPAPDGPWIGDQVHLGGTAQLAYSREVKDEAAGKRRLLLQQIQAEVARYAQKRLKGRAALTFSQLVKDFGDGRYTPEELLTKQAIMVGPARRKLVDFKRMQTQIAATLDQFVAADAVGELVLDVMAVDALDLVAAGPLARPQLDLPATLLLTINASDPFYWAIFVRDTQTYQRMTQTL